MIALVGQGTSLPERTAKVVDKDGLQESFLKHGIMLYTVTERLTGDINNSWETIYTIYTKAEAKRNDQVTDKQRPNQFTVENPTI